MALPPALALQASTTSSSGWSIPPGPSRRDFREHGDIYTDQMPSTAPRSSSSHPELVKQIFTGDPDVLHAGEANRSSAPSSASARCCCSTAPSTTASARLLMPPFHGERMRALRRRDARRHRARRSTISPVGAPFALLPRMQRHHARRHPAHRLRRRRGRALRGAPRRAPRVARSTGQSPSGVLCARCPPSSATSARSPWAAFQRASRRARRAHLRGRSPPRARRGPARAARDDVLSMLLDAPRRGGPAR